MSVEGLIKKLQEYPMDAQIFISHLCMGWIDEESIEFVEEDNVVKFMQV